MTMTAAERNARAFLDHAEREAFYRSCQRSETALAELRARIARDERITLWIVAAAETVCFAALLLGCAFAWGLTP